MTPTRQQESKQTDLPFVGCREICMAALGAMGNVLRTIPGEKGLAQACSRCNDRDGAVHNRFSIIDRNEVFWPQNRHRSSHRFKVVHEVNSVKLQVSRQRLL